nr:hypothetical protein [Haliscomenobacter sp.]
MNLPWNYPKMKAVLLNPSSLENSVERKSKNTGKHPADLDPAKKLFHAVTSSNPKADGRVTNLLVRIKPKVSFAINNIACTGDTILATLLAAIPCQSPTIAGISPMVCGKKQSQIPTRHHLAYPW